MNLSRAFRPAALVLAALVLTGCSVQNDGQMFQRWAAEVKSIPVTDIEASRQRHGAPEPVKVDVIDPVEAATTEAERRLIAAVANEGPAAPAMAPVVRDVIGEKLAQATQATAGRAVQIAAFRSEADARTAWSDLVDRHRELAGLTPQFEKVDLGSKGAWVRLKAGPITTPEAAKALCAAAGVADAWCARA
ncbi:SPOR domain-containing protein [Caulobacter sp. 17J80-11]|uniref:SPOR domain-containing protein n=1 Tax=Caulobacter sp. 17J80-11 TaxID=2763502 RepID=UPI001653A523|nr:SPOR domain-containing protein [Caulobacter sp. 17J80-11]MBC6982002.1 SPOR domain-containing protein [Caulobacter sp. 17J80-11]